MDGRCLCLSKEAWNHPGARLRAGQDVVPSADLAEEQGP